MTKTKISITGLALAVTLLISAQVKADMVTFKFEDLAPTGTMTVLPNAADVAAALTLTATERKDQSGIDFRFTSSWDGGNEAVNGGRGNIWSQYNSDYGGPAVYFSGFNSALAPNGSQAAHSQSFSVRGGNFTKLPTDEWGIVFSLNYAEDYPPTSGWDRFLSALEDGAFFEARLGNLNGAPGNVEYATFNTSEFEVTSTTPEPCTLAVLGLGLAGVGLASRRRRK